MMKSMVSDAARNAPNAAKDPEQHQTARMHEVDQRELHDSVQIPEPSQVRRHCHSDHDGRTMPKQLAGTTCRRDTPERSSRLRFM